MASSGPIEKIMHVLPEEKSAEEGDFIQGIKESLIDFAEGRYKVFKDDGELEDHLMGL